jgi:hypothetical protein
MSIMEDILINSELLKKLYKKISLKARFFYMIKMSCPEITIHKKVTLWKNKKKHVM